MESLNKNGNRLNLTLLWNGALVGFFTAVLIQGFKVALDFFALQRNALIAQNGNSLHFKLGAFLILAGLAVLIGRMAKRVPGIGGSGIAQAQLYVGRPDKPGLREFFYKYFGSMIVLASGVTAGRVGPSVHIGSLVGIGVGKKHALGQKYSSLMVLGGIALGICSIFHAPLAGILFVLEIIADRSDENVLTVMLASVASSYFFINLFPARPAFAIRDIPNLPLRYYHLLIVLIVFAVLFSKVFNYLLLHTFVFMRKIPVKKEYLPLFPFLITGVLYFVDINYVGFEHDLLMQLKDSGLVSGIALYFVIKMCLTLLTYASRIPGGLFYPVIFLGSVAGLLVFKIGGQYVEVSNLYMMNFVALGIAAFLTGVYKAPLTATVLMTELTGNFVHLLPVIVTVLFVQMGTDFLDLEPVHNILVRNKFSD